MSSDSPTPVLSKRRKDKDDIRGPHRLSLDLYYTEDQIYELSYSREAKTTKTLPATIPCKPPLVAEWVSAIEQKPDPLTFSKHFQQMVDFWCVSKQGYRCQDCGMNCHGQCKDHMSSEYKRRLKQSHSFALGSRSALPITPGSKNSSTGSEEDGFTFPRGDSTEHENGGKETTTVRLGSSDHPQINSKCLTIDAATQTESSCLDNDSNWTWTDSKMAGQDTKHQDQQYLVNDSLIEEEQKQADSRQLLQRIKELEEERDSLLIKNADLCSTNAQLEAENAHLQGQISIMHEDLEALNNRPESFSHSSVSFILQKMDSFHLQQDS
ncbi:RAS guanyl-releasing protein 1-like [Protopterus annectens]|uniref:RAS guanyl-releasing protein 1-like n=1 Tax=Protopterus annectens TaxID=7888 RepID=UPI001CF99C9E|nr:RAS guanyl-releasing protein 1-like [Protopterus annectens]